jgi:hypothetical protein
MMVSGEHDVSAASPQGNELQYLLNRMMGFAPKTVWTIRVRISFFSQESNHDTSKIEPET